MAVQYEPPRVVREEALPFFEATFKIPQERIKDVWRDQSTADFYIFSSAFGTMRLRKRAAYPATYAAILGTVLRFGYGNWQRGAFIATKDLTSIAEPLFTDEEFLYGEVDCCHYHVKIQRDATCVMPLFATQQHQMIALSNHCEHLYDVLDRKSLQISELAFVNYLIFDDMYRQPITNIEHLDDRVRMEWITGTYKVWYPNDSEISKLLPDRTGKPFEFKRVLEFTLDKYWHRYGNIAFQLSGGLDSATAPGYYAGQGKRIITAGLGYPGALGIRQRVKLNDIVQRFNLQNYIVDLIPQDHFPLIDMISGGVERLVYEHLDIYVVATRQLAALYADIGATAVFSGVGGDELCQNLLSERILPEGEEIQKERMQTKLPSYITPLFAHMYTRAQAAAPRTRSKPIPTIAYSVMLTGLGFNNTFIDRNVWPVAPLADPQLFLHAQGISAWHRHNKNLLRMYQFARGFPTSIVHPTTTEDFSEFVHLCKPYLAQVFYDFFGRSVLARQGLIDYPSLMRYCQEVVNSPFNQVDTRMLVLIRILIMEINLQRLAVA